MIFPGSEHEMVFQQLSCPSATYEYVCLVVEHFDALGILYSQKIVQDRDLYNLNGL